MNELTVRQESLPVTLPELANFVLIGREKLASVRAEIRAIQKVGLAKEVLEQKRAEAQEIAELVTLSEVKIGAMLKEIPKATAYNNPSGKSKEAQNHEVVNLGKTKTKTVEELGFNRHQVSEFQRMASHEDIVHEAIAEAKENDDIGPRAAVLKKIADSTPKPKTAKQMAQENLDRIKGAQVIPLGAAEIIREEQAVIDRENAREFSHVIRKVYERLTDCDLETFINASTKDDKLRAVETLNKICGCAMAQKNKIERSIK